MAGQVGVDEAGGGGTAAGWGRDAWIDRSISTKIDISFSSSLPPMTDTAKLFTTGRSQAVRLPKAFRFEGQEVFIRRDPRTGDVILSKRPPDWSGLFALDATTEVPPDFLSDAERAQGPSPGDPFDPRSGAS
jgi:antitoxin VapB